MTKPVKIALTVLSFATATPALAASDSGHGPRRNNDVYDARVLDEAAPPGFGMPSPYDPPGLGPYDDGNYMRNRYNWMRLPPSAHGG
jgi:hypothetical protein